MVQLKRKEKHKLVIMQWYDMHSYEREPYCPVSATHENGGLPTAELRKVKRGSGFGQRLNWKYNHRYLQK
jgi:hypothetical protein